MRKKILLLCLILIFTGCTRKKAPTIQEDETLYVTFSEAKLIQYVGDCLSYDVVRETNGLIAPQNMSCFILEEPGEITITFTVNSIEYADVSQVFTAVVTVLPAEDRPAEIIISGGNTIVGEQVYECKNWKAKETRFRVGNPNDPEDVRDTVLIKVTEENKIYLLTEIDASYWWQSDFIEEDPSVYRVLGYAQFRAGSYVPLNDQSYTGYFIIQDKQLYYIAGEMVHDLAEDTVCTYLGE